MQPFLSLLRTTVMAYGAPAAIAVALHGAVAVGVWSVGQKNVRPPRVLNSFEVVELPASAARVEPQAPEPEPESEPEPEPTTPEPDVRPEPDPTPETRVPLTPQVVPKPKPAPPPPPKPQAKPKPKPRPKPVERAAAKPQPARSPALSQPVEAEAPAPAYVAPSQHAAYLSNPKPAYPTVARKRGMEGRVVLRVQVRRDGTVRTVDVQSSTGFAILDRAARSAVLRWRFAPATRGGMAVEGEVLVPFDFRITQG